MLTAAGVALATQLLPIYASNVESVSVLYTNRRYIALFHGTVFAYMQNDIDRECTIWIFFFIHASKYGTRI